MTRRCGSTNRTCVASRFAFLLLIGLASSSALAQPAVLGGPFTFDGNDYYILEQSTWEDANAAAESMGGYLATIQSKAENDFLQTTFGNWGGSERAFWIGLNDVKYEGYFRWANGHPVTYTNWLSGQPAGGASQNFVYLRPPQYQWDDIYTTTNVCCAVTSPLHGIVEFGPRQAAGFVFSPAHLIAAIGIDNAMEENFDDFPVNGSGWGAFSNGATFGPVSLTSLSVGGDIPLLDPNLNNTGLVGTFLVDEIGGNNQVRPGGQGATGQPADDDDFRIDFSPPVMAAGLFIIDNRLETGEFVEFRRADSSVIASAALPGNSSGSGGDGYIGFVTGLEEDRIASIVIGEAGGSGTLDDDIVFDRIIWGDIDSDFDGVVDNLDNCSENFNPTQEDADGDGVGDFCDNCKTVSNPLQEETRNPGGDGDACIHAFLRINSFSLTNPPTFDLFLDCGGQAIEELNLGFQVPFGSDPMTADFGGCDEPVVPPAGVTAGTGCFANPDLGTFVDPGTSGAYGPGLTAPYVADRLYVQLRGNGPDGRLCDPFGDPFGGGFVGTFSTGIISGFLGTTSLTSAPGLERGLDINGQPVTFDSFYSGPGDPDLELKLIPAAGEDEATATRWSLCIDDYTDQRMHRVSVGMRVPGATTSDIFIEGCDSVPDGSMVRSCPGTVGPTVDKTVSFTLGPLASPASPPRVDDTLYVILEGSAPAPGATTLNPNQFQDWCLATVSIDPPAATPGVPPVLIAEGLTTLPFHDATTDPWQASSTLLTPIALENVALRNGFNTGDDLDGDGALDEADNCRFTPNTDPENLALANNGDVLLAGVNVDTDGDACECGDADGSGGVFPPDLQLIREHLVGLNAGNATMVEAICSVSEGIACNTKDAVVLQRALSVQAPGVQPRCDAALPD